MLWYTKAGEAETTWQVLGVCQIRGGRTRKTGRHERAGGPPIAYHSRLGDGPHLDNANSEEERVQRRQF